MDNMANKKTTTSKKEESSPSQSATTQKDLTAYFLGELKTAYWIEQHLLKAYDKLQSAANLPKVITGQGDVVDANIKKLEKVFQAMGIAPSGTKSLMATELINELNGVTKSAVKGERTINISIMLLILKIALYELATFQGLLALSKNLTEITVISILEELLAAKNKSIEVVQLAFEDTISQMRDNNEKEKITGEEIPVAAVYDSINLTGKVTKS